MADANAIVSHAGGEGVSTPPSYSLFLPDALSTQSKHGRRVLQWTCIFIAILAYFFISSGLVVANILQDVVDLLSSSTVDYLPSPSRCGAANVAMNQRAAEPHGSETYPSLAYGRGGSSSRDCCGEAGNETSAPSSGGGPPLVVTGSDVGNVQAEGSTNSSCQVRSDKPADEAPAMVASGGAMVDSGAGKHLTGKRQCSREELKHATPTDVVLITAKGEQHVDKQVEMHLDALNIDVLVGWSLSMATRSFGTQTVRAKDGR